MTSTVTVTREHTELLAALAQRRYFLRYTVRDLTDEQAGGHTVPASVLCLGGLIKHVTEAERSWAQFIVRGADAMPKAEDYNAENREREFQLQPGETLAAVLAEYAEVAEQTEKIVLAVPDLSADHALPVAPWFEPGARWSVRTVLTHMIGETAQHSGHADILRESLDGARTMG
jgi:hypothetical protein